MTRAEIADKLRGFLQSKRRPAGVTLTDTATQLRGGDFHVARDLGDREFHRGRVRHPHEPSGHQPR